MLPEAPTPEEFLRLLKARFGQHPQRHPGLGWAQVEARLRAHPEKLRTLWWMEATGGEPDVVGLDKRGEVVFFDCAAESPKGRRSLCYDPEALATRKEHKPQGSAVGLAQGVGVELLSEEEYHILQGLGEFDTRTSSWLRTPPGMRRLRGVLFGDRRYGRVFVYHSGAEAYYAARGFRASLRV